MKMMKRSMAPSDMMRKLVSVAEHGLSEIERLMKKNSTALSEKTKHAETAVADLKTGAVIVKQIKKKFVATFRALVEEDSTEDVDLTLYDCVIDPIDCTRGFLHNHPGIGTAIAILKNGKVIASVIGQITANSDRSQFLHDVVCGELTNDGWKAWSVSGKGFVALKSASAVLKPSDMVVYVERDAFDVCSENFADSINLVKCFTPPFATEPAKTVRMLGSSSFGFVALGRGTFSIVTGSRKPWDYLPGLPIVLGSGGDFFFYADTHKQHHVCAVATKEILPYAKEVHRMAGMTVLDDMEVPLRQMVPHSA